MRHTTPHVCLMLLAAACAASGCGADSDSSPTSPTTTTTTSATLVTDTFSGSIGQNGVAVHAFTVTTSGTSLLVGYTSISPDSVTALGIGLGSWDATTSTCSLNFTQNDSGRSGSTAISGTASAGSYCVRVYARANVGSGVTASYGVQVQHY